MRPIANTEHVWIRWYKQYWSDPAAWAFLAYFMLVVGLASLLKGVLGPFLISVVIAYLLEGLIIRCFFWMPRLYAVLAACTLFFSVIIWVAFTVLPLLFLQVYQLWQNLPGLLQQLGHSLVVLQSEYPEWLPVAWVSQALPTVSAAIADLGRWFFSLSVVTILPSFFSLIAYSILVPLLVFFFLKDKTLLFTWIGQQLPRERQLLDAVAQALQEGIGHYVRGRFLEMFLVTICSYSVFWWFGLPYALLLSTLNGLGVFFPYIGAIVATLPAILLAFLQWGVGSEFYGFLLAFIVLQLADSYWLAPILFAEAVNMHPALIILAFVVFGSLWGFWGLFFAVPLAVLCKAIVDNWPVRDESVHAPQTDQACRI